MEANHALDDAVRMAHAQDSECANALLDFLVTEPMKRIARRVVVRLLEQAREDGAAHPDLAREIAIRRMLAVTEPPEPSARDLQSAYARVSRIAGGRE